MGWRFWIDRGGTFTDLVACSPVGELHVRKLLSERPGSASDPAVSAIRSLLGIEETAPLPGAVIEQVRLGTTVATNALLEGAGAPVLLITNIGLADLLHIGDQHRPELFALHPCRPAFLAQAVLEIGGRIDSHGRELERLQLDQGLEDRLHALTHEQGLKQVAVALLHAHRNPCHERELAAWLKQHGFPSVVCSHQVCPLPALVARGQTTLVEATVAPVLQGYVDQVQAALGATVPLRVMTSSGALQAPHTLLAKDTILSGPAAGMVGAVAVARASGFHHVPVVGFDMGGTSTDVFCVSRADDDLLRSLQPRTEIAGQQLMALRLPIQTVAAGGGSVIHSDGERLQVGPRSAGADPGPACYRAGGPLTITDANLLLGRLQWDRFPAVFGAQGDQHPDADVVRARFGELAERLGRPSEQLAEGALQLALERMADAIRTVSLHRGEDVRGGVLVAYGGAGGQHACRLAEELGLETVLLHPLAGVLSAYGMGQARQRQRRLRSVGQVLDAGLLAALPRQVEEELHEARATLRSQGDLAACETDRGEHWITLELRYPQSDQTLSLPWTEGIDVGALHQAFADAHRHRFGYLPEGAQTLVLESLRVDVEALEALSPSASTTASPSMIPALEPPLSVPTVRVHLRVEGWSDLPLYARDQLEPGDRLNGPALIAESTGCTVLEPGWQAQVDAQSALLLRRASCAGGEGAGRTAHTSLESSPDPVESVLYRHRFMAIAEQMGERLRQSSRSVNIRERLDFSCALFDGRGQLVANAPHIPVHLGSMGECVKDLLAEIAAGHLPPLTPGDTVLSNDPFHGGTHLPDITAITPVFCGGRVPAFFVASRGHHADVGGIAPGSMPPFSRSIDDEGLLLRNLRFVTAGRIDHRRWQEICAAQSQPPRNPGELLADLQAQVAANQAGVQGVERLVAREGLPVVEQQMHQLQEQAAVCVSRLVSRLQAGQFQLSLDDGSTLAVVVDVDRTCGRLGLDFSGCSRQRSDNFNAPLAVTRAAVLYVLRTLLDDDIPLNEGCFAPVDLRVPEGCLLHPLPPAAVVAGNVELSQAVCNLLFGAFGVLAAGQGTMNNLCFGDAERQYYETVAGGGGAGRGATGSDGLQSHMTNSRLTDPEVLEQRYPVRIERFAFRRGSGGAGCWRGGDGLERRIRFLEPMTLSLISGSRSVAPFGLEGGDAGWCGRAELERADGAVTVLPGCIQVDVACGDAITLFTPGGGGFGGTPS